MRDHSLTAGLLIVACAMLALVQSAAAAQDAPAATAPPPEALGMADLEELAGPIALYPDELLANVLAASVYPDELKAAQEFVSKGGDTAKIAEQPWESPVKAMARIPDLLQFLVENIDWTTALGQAYIVQSKDLMAAVQSLRAKAKKSGALQTGEQVTVVEDGPTIIIEPSDPQVIYVPDYDPEVVYVDDDDGDALAAGIIGFGVGVAVGACFDDDFDCFWGGGHVGYGWGHSDVDIDRDVNIETGDINIGSGNEINRERNTERNTERTTNRTGAGREGQQWQPNSSKVDSNALRQPGGASQLGNFKGASTGQARGSNARVPTQTTARPSRGGTGAGGAGAGGARPSAGTGAGGARPSGGAGASARPASNSRAPSSARPSSSNAPSSARTSSSRAPSSKLPAPKTSAPRAPSSATRSAPAQSKAGGFSPSRGSSSASSRGSSSRSGSSGSRSSGGGSRGGGGGGRGGGGRGR